MKKSYLLTTCLFFVFSGVFASNTPVIYKKAKTINKSFVVNSDVNVVIKNKFGNLTVTTWNENRIVIDVLITVEGSNEKRVNTFFKDLDVRFSNTPSEVMAKTSIPKIKNKRRLTFKINYIVKMPVTSVADLSNDYGTVSLNRLDGNLTLNCDYGKVHIGQLFGTENTLNFDYTNKSVFKYINKGRINADYSSFILEKGNEISLQADYSDSVLESIETVTYNCDYGSLKIKEISTLSGTGDYLTIKIGELSKSIDAVADYGSIKINHLLDGFSLLNLTCDYTSIEINTPENTSFNFDLVFDYTSFIRKNELYTFTELIEKPTDRIYKGYYKSADSSSNIQIKADYGKVEFY